MLSGVQRSGLGVLVLTGLVLGGIWGLRSIPPTETAIIAAAAELYVAETGGNPTDCAARPSAMDGVRLVVICGPDWARAVDAYGRAVTLDPGSLEAERGT